MRQPAGYSAVAPGTLVYGDGQATAVGAVGERVDRRLVGRGLEHGDAPPGPRVEEQDLARDVPDGERAPVGVDGGAQDGGVVRADDADRGRAAEQRAEQVAARPHRVVERHALAGQQERAVELVVEQRAGAESLRLGRGRLVARVAALLERDGARDHAQARAARRRRPGPARSRRCERSLAVRLSVEERALGCVEVGLVVGRPVQREARRAPR